MRSLCWVGNSWIRKRGNDYFWFPWFSRVNESFIGLFPKVELVGAEADGSGLGRHLTDAADWERIDFPNIGVRTLPMRGGRIWRNVCHLVCLWSALDNAELVCIDMPNETGMLACLVCRLRRKNFFLRILGDWAESTFFAGRPTATRKIKAEMADRLARLAVRLAPLVFTQGQHLAERYGIDESKGPARHLAHSTLLPDVYHESRSAAFHNPVRILTVSALIRLKGLDVLLRAVKLMVDRGVPVEWWCVGQGPLRDSLGVLAEDLGIGDRVRFWGSTPFGPELFRFYRESDIFALLSYTEGVPSAVLEAMAQSLPVVVSSVGGLPRVIDHGVNGLLVPPGRPDALADAVISLIRSRDLVLRLRKGAFRSAQQYDSVWLAECTRRAIDATF